MMIRQTQVQAFGQQFTKDKNLARYGNGSEVLGSVPELAPLGAITMVAARSEARFRAKAAKAKAANGYTQSIGEILKIVPVEVPFDPNAGTPTFKVDMNHAG